MIGLEPSTLTRCRLVQIFFCEAHVPTRHTLKRSHNPHCFLIELRDHGAHAGAAALMKPRQEPWQQHH